MKKQIYLECRQDASHRMTLHIAPPNERDEQEVLSTILRIIEGDLGGTRKEVVEGLEQTFIDFKVGHRELSLELSPWNFISLLTLDTDLRDDLAKRMTSEFEVVARPQVEDDDE